MTSWYASMALLRMAETRSIAIEAFSTATVAPARSDDLPVAMACDAESASFCRSTTPPSFCESRLAKPELPPTGLAPRGDACGRDELGLAGSEQAGNGCDRHQRITSIACCAMPSTALIAVVSAS